MKSLIFMILLLLAIPALILGGETNPVAHIDSFSIATTMDDFGIINFFAKGFVQDASSNAYFRIKYWKSIDEEWSYIDEYQFESSPTPLQGRYSIEDDYDLSEDLSSNGNGTNRFQIYARAAINYDYSEYITSTITDTVAPSAPTSMSGSIGDDNHPTFSWTDGGEQDVLLYNIYRAHGNTAPLTWSYVNFVNKADSSSFKDKSITHVPGGYGPSYVNYRVKAVDRNNNPSDNSSSVQIQYNTRNQSGKKSVINSNLSLLPSTIELHANYPNPFNPSTTISFSLPDTKPVILNIYNVTGQKVDALVNTTLDAGSYEIEWDGTNSNGVKVSSGIYIYELVAGETKLVKKMMFAK